MQHTTFELPSEADGLSLAGYAWTPDAAPVASIQIAHGLGEHSKRYERLASALTAAGFAVYAHDHRGHGGSQLASGVLGDAGDVGWNGLVADVAQHQKLVRKEHEGLPTFLFGHSMGSFAAQQYVLDHNSDIDGVILSGSTDIATVAQMIAQSGEAPSLESYNAPFEPARTPFDWLSRDEAEVDAYIADPLCGFDPPETFSMSMLLAVSQLGDPARLAGIRNDLPMFVLAGDADPLNAGLMLLNGLIEKYKAAGLANIETKFYPDGRHEMLNETNRDEVTGDIVGWLQSRVG